MASDLLTRRGLNNGRDWDSLPADEGPLEWTLDQRQGLVQGPLELEGLRGRKLSLVLEPGQMALLIRERDLQAVYLDGAHYLDIGHGTHQVPAECVLLFLVADRHINLSWSRLEPLRLAASGDLDLIGGCSLAIDAPARFYHTFLNTPEIPDQDFLVRLVDQLVRGVLEETFGQELHGSGLTPAEIQPRLTRLGPDDLNDDLAPCGLTCLNLAVYTAAPPVENEFGSGTGQETAGQLDGVRHN